ncbi:ABC transporter substrate-binding protein [Treponema sp. OttesenSCG-928-L16]|nr:ABC transporter substrate-binding protein [Treponema sp. OttesenSCG-928-L16]
MIRNFYRRLRRGKDHPAAFLVRSCILVCFFVFSLVSCDESAPQTVHAETPVPGPLETVRYLAAENLQVSPSPLIDPSEYPAEMRQIFERGSIIFGMTAADQKPFFYTDESSGELIGLDVEIAYEIANRLGVRAEFNREAQSFDGVVLKVFRKEVDVALSKLSRTMRRASLVRFTDPYITFRQGLLVNRLELAKVSSEENLPVFIKNFQGSLAIIKNSSYVGYAAANFPEAIIKTYDTWGQCVDALFAGEVLAAYRDEGEILIINETREDAAILMKPVLINDKQDPIAMAVSQDAPMLQEWINVFLAEYLLQHASDLHPAQIVRRHFAKGAL